MLRGIILSFILVLALTINLNAQSETLMPEKQLKEKAEKYFNNKEFTKAMPLYAQLLSLYQKDTDYNFKYGATLIESSKEKEKSLTYLEYAAARPDVSPLVHFYLGKAYHLGYNFDKAISSYRKFKIKASKNLAEEYRVDRHIEMCENGKALVKDIRRVQVLEKRVVSAESFYRTYQLEGLRGRIIAKPKAFMSSYDKKVKDKSILFLPSTSEDVYFSSYGKTAKNGKDIYKITRKNNNKWGKAENLGDVINTPYDEDYAFIHPDGVTLYFASKGHNSMGGYDLFKSVYDEEKAEWSKPQNLGFSFSSVGDDILFISDKGKELAYFASNRFDADHQITVYKVKIETDPAEINIIKGNLIAESGSGQILKPSKARISVFDTKSNELIGVFETNDKGKYQIDIPEGGGAFKFSIETEDDQPIHTAIIEVPSQKGLGVLGQELRLKDEGNNQELEVLNIFDGSLADTYKNPAELLTAESLVQRSMLDENMTAEEKQNAEKRAVEKAKEPLQSVSSPIKEEAIPPKQEEKQVFAHSGKVEKLKEEEKEEEKGKIKETLQEETASKEELKAIEDIENEASRKIRRLNKYSDHYYVKAIALKASSERKFKEAASAKQNNEKDWHYKEQEAHQTFIKSIFLQEQAEEINQLILVEEENNNVITRNRKLIASSKDRTEIHRLISSSQQLGNNIPTLEDINEKQKLRWVQRNSDLTQTIRKEEEIIEELKAKAQPLYAVLNVEEREGNIENAKKLQENLKLYERQIKARSEIVKDLNSKIVDYEEIEIDIEKDLTLEELQSVEELKKSKFRNEFLLSNDIEYRQKELMKLDKELEENPILQAKEPLEKTIVEADFITNIDDIEEQSIIDDSFSSYAVNQSYEYHNPTAAQDMLMAKKALFEARELYLQAEEKKLLVYELETPEDRGNAFQEADELENKSIEKQIESIKKFSEANEKEYGQNAEILSMAKITDENRDSLALKNAQQLIKESESYFEQANELKATAFETHVPSIIEVMMQDAYDYELMAINKQKAALALLDENEVNPLLANFNENKEEQIVHNSITQPYEIDEKKYDDIDLKLSKKEEKSIRSSEEYQILIQQELKLNQLQEETQSNYEEALALRAERDELSQKRRELHAKVVTLTKKEERNEMLKRIHSTENAIDDIDSELAALNARIKENNLTIQEVHLKKENSLVHLSEQEQERYRSLAQADLKNTESMSSSFKNDERIALREIKESEISIDQGEAEELMQTKEFKEFNKQHIELKNLNEELLFAQQMSSNLQMDFSDLKFQANRLKELAGENSSKQEKKALIKEAKVFDKRANEKQKSIDSLTKEMKAKKKEIEKGLSEREKILAKLPQEKQASIVYLTSGDVNIGEDRITEKTTHEAEAEKAEIDSTLTFIPMDISKEREIQILESVDFLSFSEQQYKIYELETQRNKEGDKLIKLQEEQNSLKDGIQEIENQAKASKRKDRKRLIKEAQLIEVRVQGLQIQIDSLTNLIAEQDRVIFKEQEYGDDLLSDIPQEKRAEVLYLIGKYRTNPQGIQETIELSRLSKIKEEEKIAEKVEATEIIEKQELNLENIHLIPPKLNQSIFLRTDRNTSAYSLEKPIPKKNELPEGLVFKVQVGAFRNPIPQDLFKGFAPIMTEDAANGIKRYTAGLFNQEKIAEEARDEIRALGYSDAFVVAYFNGVRIGLSEARKMIEEGVQGTAQSSFETIGNQTAAPRSNLKKSPNQLTAVPTITEGEDEGRVNIKEVEEVFFTVQIGVFSQPVEADYFTAYEPLNFVILPTGLRRYNTGMFTHLEDARAYKEKVEKDISDAFITAYYKGERITIERANQLLNR